MMRIALFRLLALITCVPLTVAADVCHLSGTVVDADREEGLAGVVVRIVGAHVGTTTDEAGRFFLPGVPAGNCVIEATMIGYGSRNLSCACAAGDSLTDLRIALPAAPVRLAEIIVTPGRFAIMKQDPVARQTLTEDDIHTIPQFGEDIYRAVRRLPGVGGGDISARFTVRGGEHDEVLVRLDGLELYEPFHLKDFSGGLLSIIDVMAIGGIDMMAGGFPARYGNHMSGVFDMATLTPSERPRTSVGISFMNARFLTEGHFAEGRGNWLVSARRGYLDIVMELVGANEISPVYYDLLGKVEYRLSGQHLLSAHA
ncbi:MAG: TonB-dependent receptor, partial [Gemmatimonadetes bacterium]|nr:TonB-dependent receptor [Gemmatimonadota bacterium]